MNLKFMCEVEDPFGRRTNSINIDECEENIRNKIEGDGCKLLKINPVNNGLLFGVDFDGTFAADPSLFREIIKVIVKQGHQIVFVTGRSELMPSNQEVKNLIQKTFDEEELIFPIVFAGDKWKKEAAIEAGFLVNIWIDDNPEWIGPQ